MISRSVRASLALAAIVSTNASLVYAQDGGNLNTSPVHTIMGIANVPAAERAPVDHGASTFVAMSDWSTRVQRALDQKIRHPQRVGPVFTSGNGVVRIKFNCSESGKPDKITLAKSSGDWALDRAAVRAMKQRRNAPSIANWI